jgi:tRNA(Ile)-lysidine synthase
MNRTISLVERTIAAALVRAGVQPGAGILIALSGGADSVALVHALHRLRDRSGDGGYEISAAHLNHRLRGAESDRDEGFVRELCDRLKVNLLVEVADDLAGSSNLEERARTRRYEFLNHAAGRLQASHIAVAHHADDQAETVMLRLLRGSGAAGLAAMNAAGPGRIVRPMLTLRREQILAYLEAIGAACVTDSSNASSAILRNRVRHELLPMLERGYAPKLRRRLAGLADELRALDDYLMGEARRELGHRLQSPARLDLAGFATLHPALSRAVLREWLRMGLGDLRRIYRADLERMHELCSCAAPGSIMELSCGWRLRCEYGVAVLEAVDPPVVRMEPGAAVGFELELSSDGVTVVPEAGFTFTAQRSRLADVGFPGAASIARTPRLEAFFDADEIARELCVRGFRRGDRIHPLGMDGTRKVHDVFIDHKLPRARRQTWPLVESRGRILWIPGMVRSRCALVTAATQNLLRFTAQPDAITKNTSLLRI